MLNASKVLVLISMVIFVVAAIEPDFGDNIALAGLAVFAASFLV
jgi:hypothetical protein